MVLELAGAIGICRHGHDREQHLGEYAYSIDGVHALRGQTVSLYMLSMRGGISLGGLLTGSAIGHWGVRNTLMIDGLLALVLQVAIGWHWLRSAVIAETAP